jgi:hypothetical protein
MRHNNDGYWQLGKQSHAVGPMDSGEGDTITYSSNGLRAPLFYVTSLCCVLHGPYNRSYCSPEASVEMNVNSPSYGL